MITFSPVLDYTLRERYAGTEHALFMQGIEEESYKLRRYPYRRESSIYHPPADTGEVLSPRERALLELRRTLGDATAHSAASRVISNAEKQPEAAA